MKVIVVDEKDNILGYKDRNDKNKTDIIRVSGLWIFNSSKEVLIAQRSLGKIHDPGKWGPSAAGTVEEGETYASNITKEAREELGVTIKEKDLISGLHELHITSHKHFVQIFFTKLDVPVTSFILQKEEVEAVRWISTRELSEWLSKKPNDFIASFKPEAKEIFDFLISH